MSVQTLQQRIDAVIADIKPSEYIRPHDVISGIGWPSRASGDIREAARFTQDERHPIRRAAIKIVALHEEEFFFRHNRLVPSYRREPNGWRPVVYRERWDSDAGKWRRDRDPVVIGLEVCPNRDTQSSFKTAACTEARKLVRMVCAA